MLDPGAQVVSGLQRYADGVSRRRDTRDSAAQAPHGEVLMDSVGVLALKSVPKPLRNLEDRTRNSCPLRS